MPNCSNNMASPWTDKQLEKLISWMEENHELLRGNHRDYLAKVKAEALSESDDIGTKEIGDKITSMKTAYKAAQEMQEQPGFGPREEDCYQSVNEKLARECPFFWRLDAIWGAQPNDTPVYALKEGADPPSTAEADTQFAAEEGAPSDREGVLQGTQEDDGVPAPTTSRQANTSTYPDTYTTDHSDGVLRTHMWRTVANSAAYLQPLIKPDMSILDIGCGPGSITVDLATFVPQGKVIGIEYTAAPLSTARAIAARREVKNVEFRTGDIHSLDFPDDSFDIVHAHQVLQHIADPIHALREMRRVVKTGGGLVAARESASFSWSPGLPGLELWADVHEKMARAKGGNPNPGYEIHLWAQQAGFEESQITCSRGSWCFSNPEERAYFGGSMAERVSSSGFATMAVDGGYSTPEQLAEMARDWQSFIDNDGGWFTVMHGEIICRV